tara:strand:+ start:166 stop:666 length:501 start_codon:yes stop_codon:yes gene_type:complete
MILPFHKIKADDINLTDVNIIAQHDEYEGFNCSILDTDKLLENNSFLKWLYSKYKFTAAILQIDPYMHFIWHKDAKRGVTINSMLSDGKSHTLFSDDVDNAAYQATILPLPYIKDKLFLFNTQVSHCVFNFNKKRQMFSVEFETSFNDGLTYNDVLKTIKEEYYSQ